MAGEGTGSYGGDTAYIKLVTGQSSVTTAVTTVVEADVMYRGRLCLCNNSTETPVFVSQSSSVTAGDGFMLPPRVPVWFPFSGKVYGITSSGTAVVSYAECK